MHNLANTVCQKWCTVVRCRVPSAVLTRSVDLGAVHPSGEPNKKNFSGAFGARFSWAEIVATGRLTFEKAGGGGSTFADWARAGGRDPTKHSGGGGCSSLPAEGDQVRTSVICDVGRTFCRF